MEAYRDRVGLLINLDSLERSLRGETAAHAKWREQANKGLGIGQRMELDVTARQEQQWLEQLTEAELLMLKALRDRALARAADNGNTQTLVIQGVTGDAQS